MCIDDYQFRHYSAVRPKQCRRIAFINEDDIQKAFLINISQFQENGQIALCKIIFHLSGKGLQIANRKFYWPKFNVSVQPGDYCKVPFAALSDKQIVFHSIPKIKQTTHEDSQAAPNETTSMEDEAFQKKMQTDDSEVGTSQCTQCQTCMVEEKQAEVRNSGETIKQQQSHQQTSQNLQQSKSDQQSIKRMKQPQRQIGQVIIAVKKWRKLYESKRLNLTKAAKLIGISKKSLDDYYLVLRVGEILGFDYDSNLSSRMGDLRAYIRAFNHKVTGKLSKEVKCFQLVPDFDVQKVMEQQGGKILSTRTEFE